jgi:PEP-CTERM motif
MRIVTHAACLALLWLPASVQAEPFTVQNGSVVFNVVVSTHGFFTCQGTLQCSGTGTDSVTFGSGDRFATVTFTGVTDAAAQVGNRQTPMTLGVFETSSTPGFLFPTRLHQRPIVLFDLLVDVSSPVAANKDRTWSGYPGGHPDLRLFPAQSTSSAFSVPAGPNPPGSNYSILAFEVHFPIVLSSAASANVSAQVSAVPEPATLLLVGAGLAGAGWSRRRSRSFTATSLQ